MRTISKNTTLTAAAFLIGITLGGGLAYQFGSTRAHEHSHPEQSQTYTESDSIPEIPENNQDFKPPEGAVSPHEVAIQPFNYIDKDIKLYGKITSKTEGQFSLVSTKSDEPLGVALDFSKADLEKPTETVTVSGKLTQKKAADGSFTLSLIVDQISK